MSDDLTAKLFIKNPTTTKVILMIVAIFVVRWSTSILEVSSLRFMKLRKSIPLNKELKARINKAFGKLNDKERIVANLYFKKEYEYAEIEEKTGFPMGTVKGIINRVRAKLQIELGNVRFA